jgi:outer membrane immunogenic protein
MKNAKLYALALLSAFAVSPAVAADLPVKAAPMPAMVPIATWSGFYIGLNGGYSWGNSSRDVNFFNPLNGVTIATGVGGGRDLDGGLFGGQIGYNWQTSNWVFGIEADAQWTGQKGSTTALCAGVGACFPGLTALPPAGVASTATVSDKLEWFGTIRGRVGVTFTPTVLLYVTGGGAYGSVQTDVTIGTFTANGTPVAFGGSRSTDRFGWTVGGGIEWGFASNWSAKIEYLYMDLGSISNSVVSPTATLPLGANVTTNLTDNIFRGGINYRFAPGRI